MKRVDHWEGVDDNFRNKKTFYYLAILKEKDEWFCFRGLEHEDVLLPAGRLQLGSVVRVQQQPHGPCDHDGGSSGASWLIRRFRRPWDRERKQRDPFDAGITALTWSIIVLALLLTGRWPVDSCHQSIGSKSTTFVLQSIFSLRSVSSNLSSHFCLSLFSWNRFQFGIKLGIIG